MSRRTARETGTVGTDGRRSGAARLPPYRRSRFLAQRGARFTDAPDFSRSHLPAVLSCVTNVCLLFSLLEDKPLPVV